MVRYEFEFLLGRINCFTPDKAMLRYMIGKVGPKFWKAPKDQRKLFYKICLEIHHNNQQIYYKVMR